MRGIVLESRVPVIKEGMFASSLLMVIPDRIRWPLLPIPVLSKFNKVAPPSSGLVSCAI